MFRVGLVEFDVGHFDQGSSYGDQTVYRVEVDPGTLEAANAMRWQLQGQKGSVVGVTWDDDPAVDGIYEMSNVSVAPISNYLIHGRMAATVSLRRVSDRIEASQHVTVRDDLTPTNLRMYGVHAYAATTDVDQSDLEENNVYLFDSVQESGEPDGTKIHHPYSQISYTVADSVVAVRQGCIPSMLELGRARIEVKDPAGVYGWWTLTGDKVPEGHDVRIGNGRVRITVVAGADYVLQEQYDGTPGVWDELARFAFHWDYTTYGNPNEFSRRFKVVRNERAGVVLRCALTLALQPTSYVALSVMRGDTMAFATLSGGMGAPSETSKVVMRSFDGATLIDQSGMSLSDQDGAELSQQDDTAIVAVVDGNNLRSSARISGQWARIFADTTGITVTAATETVSKTASDYLLVGFGSGNQRFRANTQLVDRTVR